MSKTYIVTIIRHLLPHNPVNMIPIHVDVPDDVEFDVDYLKPIAEEKINQFKTQFVEFNLAQFYIQYFRLEFNKEIIE